MTSEELFSITKIVSFRLYELGNVELTVDDGGVVDELSNREVAALATGVGSLDTLFKLTPPKPLSEMTMGDIDGVVQAIVANYVGVLNNLGLLNRADAAAEGDAND